MLLWLNHKHTSKHTLRCVLLVYSHAFSWMNSKSTHIDLDDGWVLVFYLLATSIVMSGPVVTCDCTHGDFLMLSHWEIRLPAPWSDIPLSHIIQPTSACPILIMPNTWLRSNHYQFLCHWFDSARVRKCVFESHILPKWESGRSTHSAITHT